MFFSGFSVDITKLFHPSDPSSLGLIRFVFGKFILIGGLLLTMNRTAK